MLLQVELHTAEQFKISGQADPGAVRTLDLPFIWNLEIENQTLGTVDALGIERLYHTVEAQ